MIAATPFHADALALLHGAAFPEPERWSAAAFAQLLELAGTFGWLTEGAMILARTAADEAEILTLATAPLVRRQGHASGLLAAALAEAAARGARAVLLEVAETNRAACALYGGFGFVPVGRRPRYYRDGADALILRAGLPCGSGAR